MIYKNIETYEAPPSLIKYEPPLDITQKLEAYRQANFLPGSSDSKPSQQDILNIILPPREWIHNGLHYLQYVSHSQPEREDVELVKKKLEQTMLKLQARPQGICPIKEKIFAETFDQIIRQVTLDSPERGLILMRVRDERKMTISAYQTVYEEGVAYGVQKQAEAEQGMDQLEGQVNALEQKQRALQKRKEELLIKKQSMQQKYRERRVVETEKMQYEVTALTSQNQSLQQFLQKFRRLQQVQQQEQEEQDQNQV